MEVVRAYDEDGNKVYIYCVARGIFLDDTESKTLSNLISDYNQKFTNIDTDVTNIKKDKINVSDIVDNFTGKDSKKPLSATRGKYLYDNSLVFKGTVPSNVDLNTLVEPGIYFIDDASNMSHTPTKVEGQTSKSFINIISYEEMAVQEIIRLRDSTKWTRSKVSDSAGWESWYKYKNVKTTIEDKAMTSLTLPDNKGTLNYFIEDGWCTVEFKDIAGDGTNLDIIETEELLTPSLTQPCVLEADGVMVGTAYISGRTSGDGVKITAHKNSSTLGFGTVSYKIDQSKY